MSYSASHQSNGLSCRQSAGAGSVDYYSYAYIDKPIVNAFILESGTVTSFSDPVTPNNLQAWFNASKQLGCGDASVGAEKSIACMRNQTTQSLLGAIAIANPLQAILGNFGPTADNKVVFSDYKARAAKGQFIKRPYFAGNNNYEAGLFRLFGSISGFNITDIEWCLFNLEIFTCPAARAVAARALAGVPTYRYRYFGEFANMRLTANPNSGAWHGSEIPVVWGTSNDASGVANTDIETGTSNYLQGAWAAFAKDPERAFANAPYSYPRFDPLGK
jgi:cholinesterase